MTTLNRSTLAFRLGALPPFQGRDFSELPVKGIVKCLAAFRGAPYLHSLVGVAPKYFEVEKPMGRACVDATMFYLLNHAVSEVRKRLHPSEELGDYLQIVEAYQEFLGYKTPRMFYYLLLICTREARHEKSLPSSLFWKSMISTYGEKLVVFHSGLGNSPDKAVAQLMTNPPDCSIGTYVKFLCSVFFNGKFNDGYGGKAWGAVCDVLRKFVFGEYSAELMMDTAFTMAHNNGTIFSKLMLFELEERTAMLKLLDIQRSGQIPQMLANKESPHTLGSAVYDMHKVCADLLGPSMLGYVDWFLVVEVGGSIIYPKDKYKHLQSLQVAAHGYSNKFQAKLAVEDAKQPVPSSKSKTVTGGEGKSKVLLIQDTYVTKVEVRG